MNEQAIHMEQISIGIAREGLKLYDAKKSPFRLYGVWHDGKRYRRVPKDYAEATSAGVAECAEKTAGGRVRFITDSPYIVIKCVYAEMNVMTHMALCGIAGFDMYTYVGNKELYTTTFRPPHPSEIKGGFEGVYDFSDAKERMLNINFPLYNEVEELYIGIKEGSVLKPAADYKYEKPIVYYGSSITQGGCASRPGTTYQGFVTRHFDINHINLGFSGNARGEEAIGDYIASLDMSVFVYDYDHNAPSKEHLLATHEPMFKKIRKAHPDLPIIMMSRPKFIKTDDEIIRNEIIKKTYDNAKAASDENVYFISGTELCLDNENTVDGCHPTDYGFKCMADKLIALLEKILP